MTAFSFLHAADLHLGSPFEGLAVKDADIAMRFAEATRAAFVEMIDRAIAERVAFVVIAGDVYDGQWKDNSIGLFFNRQVSRLARENIQLFLLKGNHDADSVVTKTIALPDSVQQFETRSPTTFTIDALKVALHGQGFAERAATENLALTYPPALPGLFNIGVLHTSLTGRPPHANYAPCSVDDLRSRGYDYWALGHVHDHEVISTDPHIVFPGNMQGRNIRETGEKGAVIVHVEDGRIARMERMIVDQARFASHAIDVSDLETLDALYARLRSDMQALDAFDRLVALRLHLTGETTLHGRLLAERVQVQDDVQAVLHHVHDDLWLEKLKIDVTASRAMHASTEESLDLGPQFDRLVADPQMLERAESIVQEIAGKMPNAALMQDYTAADLLAEARALVLSSTGGGGRS